VGDKGFEPLLPFGKRILSPPRLPIPPIPREMNMGASDIHSGECIGYFETPARFSYSAEIDRLRKTDPIFIIRSKSICGLLLRII
jgi:hypothetical protein